MVTNRSTFSSTKDLYFRRWPACQISDVQTFICRYAVDPPSRRPQPSQRQPTSKAAARIDDTGLRRAPACSSWRSPGRAPPGRRLNHANRRTVMDAFDGRAHRTDASGCAVDYQHQVSGRRRRRANAVRNRLSTRRGQHPEFTRCQAVAVGRQRRTCPNAVRVRFTGRVRRDRIRCA